MRLLAIIFTLFTLTLKAEEPPLPTLTTFFYPADGIIGMYWFSDGSDYTYTLEVNEFDGWGWFDVYFWIEIPQGTIMNAYTIIQPSNYAAGSVRVERTKAAPEHRGILKWKVLRPIRF